MGIHGIADAFGLVLSTPPAAVEKLVERTPESGDRFFSSDVDIGVRPIPGHRLSVRDKARLACALEDLLDVNRVDLVDLSECDAFLAANVVRGGEDL
ncbi:MAG: nucleotidyltransferase domain-containing protein [Thermodesulfobacteriota bacterium]